MISAAPNRRRTLAVLIAATVIGAAACTSTPTVDAPVDGTSATQAPVTAPVACGSRRTVTYAQPAGSDPNLTSLDVYLPPDTGAGCQDRPLVVWVHGGGWTEGDKTDHMADKVALFNGAGFVFASVNYRLTDPMLAPPSPRYPVHDQDAADAVAWLVRHADELGVDPTRVAVLGHSAGGGIVAAISTDPRYLGANGLGLDALRCAATMDGEGFDIAVGATHPSPEVQKVYRDAFGDDPAVWADASPLQHVAPGQGTPDFFVAARGGAVRVELHLELVAALRAAGVPTTVLDARELTHADLAVDVGAPDDAVVTPALMSFLDGCLAGASGPAGSAPVATAAGSNRPAVARS